MILKHYKYTICNRANIGSEENPNWIESFVEKMIPKTASNEQIAKLEAYKGEYAIVDDGMAEDIDLMDDIDNMLIDHEMRLTMLELDM